MKKTLVCFLSLVLVFLVSTTAFASTDFEYHGSETGHLLRWGPSEESSGSNWHITWGANNLAPDKRAVVRILSKSGEYASSLWVYSSASTNYHPYKAGYGKGQAKTYIAGKLDDRDTGTLDVKGVFHN